MTYNPDFIIYIVAIRVRGKLRTLYEGQDRGTYERVAQENTLPNHRVSKISNIDYQKYIITERK
jgi:hypothetical protein